MSRGRAYDIGHPDDHEERQDGVTDGGYVDQIERNAPATEDRSFLCRRWSSEAAPVIPGEPEAREGDTRISRFFRP
jgi:hypothetical protein